MKENVDPIIEMDEKKLFPIEVRLHGILVATLHADGSATGSMEAIQAILENMKPHQNQHAMQLWIILFALKNARIIGVH